MYHIGTMRTYTGREIAEILRIHPRSVARLIRRGELGGFKVGRMWRVTEQDLEKFIEERRANRVE